MKHLPPLTEAMIRQHASKEALERGQDTYQRGAVTNMILRSTSLRAQVRGTEYLPFRVRVNFDLAGITTTSCTCSQYWVDWCEHTIATLLVYSRQPETVTIRPELAESLRILDRDQLQNLLLVLSEQNMDIADMLEAQIALLEASDFPPAALALTHHMPVDPEPIRREMRTILRPAGYGRASGAVEEVRQLLQQVQRFVERGDGRNALILLEAITDEYTQHWFEIDDSSDELGAFFENIAEYWAEALLSVELPEDEREVWSTKLYNWQETASEYGVDDWFELAQAATYQGWDDPALQDVLQGKSPEPGQSIASHYGDKLNEIRLKHLERQGRFQEYIYLAKAAGRVREYVTMLARMGRIQEAFDKGLELFTTANDALMLARVLREQGALEPAMRIAEHGLTLAEPKGHLATWLTDLAAGLGQRELALHAAQIGFRSQGSLHAYLTVQELAGDDWPILRSMLLDELRTNTTAWGYGSEYADIFLHEGLIDDAIAMIDSGRAYGAMERVMDAALSQRPDWVIDAATAQANRIIDAGKAQRYDDAIEWLRRARDAYHVASRQDDWHAYLKVLRREHGRKYKLMGLIDSL